MEFEKKVSSKQDMLLVSLNVKNQVLKILVECIDEYLLGLDKREVS